MNADQFHKYVESEVARLSEHVPGSSVAIQVMVSWINEKGETVDVMVGSGNWFARLGMLKHLIDRDRAYKAITDYHMAQIGGWREP